MRVRTVEFETFGLDGSATARRGSLAELLKHVPTVLVVPPGVIPPLRVVNDILRRGSADAGMSGGCRWRPFSIDAGEWDELRAALEGGRLHEYAEPPEWVRTWPEWSLWRWARARGISAEGLGELRRAFEQESRWQSQADAADAAGEAARAAECRARAHEAAELARAIIENRPRTPSSTPKRA